MKAADGEVKILRGRAAVFRHPDDEQPEAGQVWILWAMPPESRPARFPLEPLSGSRILPLVRISHQALRKMISGLWQNRAQRGQDEDPACQENAYAGRHSVAQFPSSAGARFCFSSAHGGLFR